MTRATTDVTSIDALWRVDMDGVSDCAARYLKAPWGNAPPVEQLMVEALAFAEIQAFAFHIQGVGGVLPKTARKLWNVVKAAVVVIIVWYVANGADARFGHWAGILVFGVFLAYALRFRTSEKAKLFGDMCSVYQILGHSPVCTALVRERVFATSNAGAVWPAGMPNLVERAYLRNAASWDS